MQYIVFYAVYIVCIAYRVWLFRGSYTYGVPSAFAVLSLPE